MKTNPECGCPEIECSIGMAEVILHLEPDGKCEAFIDFADWQEEKTFKSKTMDELQIQAEAYIKSLPPE